ncbi:hypothetical protein EB796_008398 [Bugula neritina]|uniref:Uncharacterized protein n=1 Tax=Bugula neritina TaxID=10212 RepID=A0A7J7K4Z8_BUGNE|nr:hypothetical protein EB796_008398 [Bugula neritina]
MVNLSIALSLFLAVVVSAGPRYPEDSCTCFEKGNYYSPVSSDNCRSFTQRTAFLPAETQRCPHGLQFDVKTCVCNHPENTVCPYHCPRSYSAPAHYSRSCSQNGNTYRQLTGTKCHQFTQETAHLPPQVYSCPSGLQFDLRTCVCNYFKNTICYTY